MKIIDKKLLWPAFGSSTRGIYGAFLVYPPFLKLWSPIISGLLESDSFSVLWCIEEMSITALYFLDTCSVQSCEDRTNCCLLVFCGRNFGGISRLFFLKVPTSVRPCFLSSSARWSWGLPGPSEVGSSLHTREPQWSFAVSGSATLPVFWHAI